jgi:hypothetical protein
MQPKPATNHYLPVDFNRQYHALAGLATEEFPLLGVRAAQALR